MEPNLRFYEKGRQVPDNAIKPIQAGRLKGKSNINPMWRIKMLTEFFGPCGIGWYYDLLNQQFVPGSNDEIAVFVDIKLYYLENEKWSQPIHGTGGAMFVSKETKGLYTDDEAIKKATTDAISVAAKELGIGADVYWQEDSTKYDKKPETPPKSEKQKEPPKTKEWNDLDKQIKERIKGQGISVVQFYDVFKRKYEKVYLTSSVDDLKKCLEDMDKKEKDNE